MMIRPSYLPRSSRTATTSNCGSLIGKWRRFLRCLTIPRQHQIVNEQLAKRRLGLQGRAFQKFSSNGAEPCKFLLQGSPLWKIRLKNKLSAAHMSYGSKLASRRAKTKSFIIWLNKNYETRINPHHCVPQTICKYG